MLLYQDLAVGCGFVAISLVLLLQLVVSLLTVKELTLQVVLAEALKAAFAGLPGLPHLLLAAGTGERHGQQQRDGWQLQLLHISRSLLGKRGLLLNACYSIQDCHCHGRLVVWRHHSCSSPPEPWQRIRAAVGVYCGYVYIVNPLAVCGTCQCHCSGQCAGGNVLESAVTPPALQGLGVLPRGAVYTVLMDDQHAGGCCAGVLDAAQLLDLSACCQGQVGQLAQHCRAPGQARKGATA